MQVRDSGTLLAACRAAGLHARVVGRVVDEDRITFGDFTEKRSVLRGIWSETTHAIQRLRDDPTCADEEQASRVDPSDPGNGMDDDGDGIAGRGGRGVLHG